MSAEAASSLYVSIVLWNSARAHGAEVLEACFASLLSQEGLATPPIIHVIDNGSDDDSAEIAEACFGPSALVEQLPCNLGFCGGHNHTAAEFLASEARYLLILNPDVVLSSSACSELLVAAEGFPSAGLITPLLFRAGSNGQPERPTRIDAAGMRITKTLRHFDRLSNAVPDGCEQQAGWVFGGTGACLLIRRECLNELRLDNIEYDDDLYRVYPQLKEGRSKRVQLFDESFFAYREDAELSWRADRLGWGCRYAPKAIGWHRRVVVPERRSTLPAILNFYGVRNRFLLQLNHVGRGLPLSVWLAGVLWRNLLVVIGVVLSERSSIGAFRQVWQLARRARSVQATVSKRSRSQLSSAQWFYKDIK